LRLIKGEDLGTRFLPAANKLEARKHYILSGSRKAGSLEVDAGAAHALAKGGSLLPAGIVRVSGDFERGDTVRVLDSDARQIAVGLSSYASSDLARLCGKQSSEIEAILGYTFGDEAIHRNNMVLG
jgi:glutamate 5-kinase